MKGMTSGLNANRSPLHEEALAWVEKNAGTGKYANVDKSRLGAAGQSCGGLETCVVTTDGVSRLTWIDTGCGIIHW
jgi:hypothetical protein